MKALVIYDSYFGNTETVAKAIAAELESQGEVLVKKVTEAAPADLEGVTLFVVGSPTRAFKPTAVISNFIKVLPAQGLKGVRVAGFDTRVEGEDAPKLFRTMIQKWYAAKPIDKALQKKGGESVLPPDGFYVAGEKGPLLEGELERAKEWARAVL